VSLFGGWLLLSRSTLYTEIVKIASLRHSKSGFSLLALDQVALLAEILGLDLSVKSNKAIFERLIKALGKAASNTVSGMILEPQHTFPFLSSAVGKTPIALRLDKTGLERDLLALPQFSETWGVEQIANNYAVVSLFLNYHPDEDQALHKKQLLAEVYEYCCYQGAELLLQLNVSALPNTESDTTGSTAIKGDREELLNRETESLIEAVQELRAWCHALAVPAPKNALTAVTLTAELDHPWLAVLPDAPYSETKETVRQALENGAQGWLAGSALWYDVAQLQKPGLIYDWDEVERFLLTQVRDRVIELTRITNEVSYSV
jgi:tagatose 1,6-diphosphate aldolase